MIKISQPQDAACHYVGYRGLATSRFDRGWNADLDY